MIQLALDFMLFASCYFSPAFGTLTFPWLSRGPTQYVCHQTIVQSMRSDALRPTAFIKYTIIRCVLQNGEPYLH